MRLVTRKVPINPNVVDALGQQVAARVGPHDKHNHAVDSRGCFESGRGENFGKVSWDVGEVVQVRDDRPIRHKPTEDVAEVQAVRCYVVNQHLLEIRRPLIEEQMLNEVSKMKTKGEKRVIQD